MAGRAAAITEVFVFRESTGLLLSWQVVEWAVVFPADHLGTFDRVEFLEAAVLFEDLGECFQLRRAFRPLPFGPAEAFFEFPREAFEVEVFFRKIVNGVVTVCLQFHVIQIRVDRGRDVAGERPGSRRPHEKRRIFFSINIKTHKYRWVIDILVPLRQLMR